MFKRTPKTTTTATTTAPTTTNYSTGGVIDYRVYDKYRPKRVEPSVIYEDMLEWMNAKIASLEDLASREIIAEEIIDITFDGYKHRIKYTNRDDVEGAKRALETLRAMRRELVQNFGNEDEGVDNEPRPV